MWFSSLRNLVFESKKEGSRKEKRGYFSKLNFWQGDYFLNVF